MQKSCTNICKANPGVYKKDNMPSQKRVNIAGLRSFTFQRPVFRLGLGWALEP